MQPLSIDHIFLLVEPEGHEIAALHRLGLTDTYRRAHPGQGTQNACFAFDNLYLDLLWLTDEADARAPAIARTRLWERSQWRAQGTCPFGLALRGDLAAVGAPTWDYRPPYLPPDQSVPIATSSDDPTSPMVFVSPGRDAPAAWPAHRRDDLQHPAGFGPILAVELGLPAHAAADPRLRPLTCSLPGLTRCTPGYSRRCSASAATSASTCICTASSRMAPSRRLTPTYASCLRGRRRKGA
ncbi:MAG: VOC family protein [Nannocystis sp.]|nr:VOC family protein [Nannocystis sp.]